ncbi:MAG: hypothetical protein ACQESW_13300, partial [Bacteroidota bacterium]
MRAKFTVLAIVCSFFLFTAVDAQERFWVNGSGSWSDPTHWSETSGGEGGASVPTLDNPVIFDAQSFQQANGQVQIADEAFCKSLLVTREAFTLKSKGFLFKQLTGAQLHVAGDVVIPASLKDAFYGDWLLTSGEEATIDVATGLHGNVVFDNPDGQWELAQPLETSGDVLVKKGSLKTNGHKLRASTFFVDSNNEQVQNFSGSEIHVDR